MRNYVALATTALVAAPIAFLAALPTPSVSAAPLVASAFAQDTNGAGADPAATAQEEARQGALERLLGSLAAEGIDLDLAGGMVTIDATVLMRDQLVEHLLVGPGGATHESLFLTQVTPRLLNAAILALGTNPGKNATWVKKEAPAPTPQAEGDADPADESDRPGDGRGNDRPEYRILPPSGDGLYLHAAWREGEEVYFFRIEDLIANLATGRSMERQRLVFLGSRMAKLAGIEPRTPGEEPREVFVADYERNLISLIYFAEGNTLFTCVHGDENRQDIWAANIWNLPEMQQPVRLVFSKKPLASCPESMIASLPEVKRSED